MTDTAIILAGGFGTRLQSVISNLPKPMAPVNGVPFLSYQFNYLRAAGIRKAILSVGYLSEAIQSHYKSAYQDLSLDYVVEEQPLGTGGGIRKAMEHCNAETAFVLNGDSFFDVALEKFFRRHSTTHAQCSLALRAVDNAARYGQIATDSEHRIVSFREKSDVAQAGTINGGVYLLHRDTYLSGTPADKAFSIEKDFFEKQLDKLIIRGFEFEGYFIDIGVPEDYMKAQDDFKEFKYR